MISVPSPAMHRLDLYDAGDGLRLNYEPMVYGTEQRRVNVPDVLRRFDKRHGVSSRPSTAAHYARSSMGNECVRFLRLLEYVLITAKGSVNFVAPKGSDVYDVHAAIHLVARGKCILAFRSARYGNSTGTRSLISLSVRGCR